MAEYTTTYSRQKNVNTLNKGSFEDYGDGTPARQVLSKQPTGDVYDVNITSASGTSIIQYNEAASIVVGSETQINSYTVPVGKTFTLARVRTTGCNRAKYIVKINGSTIDSGLTWWTRFNLDLPFDNLSLVANDIVSVHVINQGTTVEAFESLILGNEK